MALYLNEMQNFIKLASNSNFSSEVKEEEVITESVQPLIPTYSKVLVEDIKDAVFRMQSFREDSVDQNYALGVENGLALAADMITKVIERFVAQQDSI
jgi:hypothetical protein